MSNILDIAIGILTFSWRILMAASPFVFFGALVAGLFYIFVNPDTIFRYFGRGKVKSVFLASLFGVPIPLCSCGVIPVALSLRKQGASRGATLSFLISTPESGIDSIAVTYALMDPLMTVLRPVSAFISAFVAGILGNYCVPDKKTGEKEVLPSDMCKVDNCCDGVGCAVDVHRTHHTFFERIVAGGRYAFGDLFSDFALWFVIGIIIAGAVDFLVPEGFLNRYLGGGLPTMLLMLVFGIPLYICATASTPIAAALVASGISPGAALVFLLAGPATNLASLSVISGALGKRTAIIYVSSISVVAVAMGLVTDFLYPFLHIIPRTLSGSSSEFIPGPIALILALITIMLLGIGTFRNLKEKFEGHDNSCAEAGSCALDHHEKR